MDDALGKVPNAHSEWYWRFTALKAEILIWKGLNKESLALLQQDLPPSLQTSDTAIWRKLTRASALTNDSDYPGAARSLAEAEKLARANHPELLGYVALRQGTLSDYQSDLNGASAQYHAALNAARDVKDSYLGASALGSLGLLETEQAHYDSAVDWNREGLQVAESAGAKSLAAKIRLNTGWNYFELGDYEMALKLFEQADAAAGTAGLLKDQAICRTNTGAVDYYLRNYSEAEANSLQALQLARNLDEKRLVTESLNTLSSVAIAGGRLDAAESYNREALELSRSIHDRAGETSSQLIAGQIEAGRKQFSRAEELFGQIVRDQTASPASRWEAEARLASVYAQEEQPAKAEREYKRAIATIQTARQSIEEDELRLTFLSSAIDFYDDYIDFLMRQGETEVALGVADRTHSQTLTESLASAQKTPSAVSREPAPRQLAQQLHASLLLYWVGQKHSYLWVATPARLSTFMLPQKSQIDPVVKKYRQAILGGEDVLTGNHSGGEQLYAMLLGPTRNLVPRNSRVILLPAESLSGVNFETLIVPEPRPHFWIEDVTMSTASSLAILSTVNQGELRREKNLLLVGNPEPANGDFPRLQQAPAEMQKISGHFPQTKREVLEGSNATPAAYVGSNPDRFAYVHFVAHGTASHTQPLESAVILSRQGDSYKLYAREIVKHQLKAELVTISACNGVGTRAYAGEGLVGLSWAFLRAGAHHVIASLWEVSDSSSTPQLMDELYKGLERGEDPATALRNAKLLMIKSNAHTVFAKPFYWAPFQLYSGS
ncbi:MAG TPA: CHAT domain-containing protein [Candidatus Acidoferrum sp.]|nr:CHAT domain-containing protein [Candidatus Acidoferrum sp.]